MKTILSSRVVVIPENGGFVSWGLSNLAHMVRNTAATRRRKLAVFAMPHRLLHYPSLPLQ